MSPSRSEPIDSTTGVVGVFNGTKDGLPAHVNWTDGSTNLNPFKMMTVKVENVRSFPEQPTVKKNGNQLVNFTTSLPADHFLNEPYSPANKSLIEDVYFDECRRLVQELTGAAEAHPFVYWVRNQSNDKADFYNCDYHNDSVPLLHVDRDTVTAPDRLRASLGEEKGNALLAKYKTYGSMNVWRPIKGSVEKWPLLMVNHSAVPDWHYDTYMGRIDFSNDKRVAGRGAKPHERILKFDPRYNFHYADAMSTEEAWLFYSFHSNPQMGVPHGAFWDEKTKPDAPTRWSVEVRVWLFFDEDGNSNSVSSP